MTLHHINLMTLHFRARLSSTIHLNEPRPVLDNVIVAVSPLVVMVAVAVTSVSVVNLNYINIQ